MGNRGGMVDIPCGAQYYLFTSSVVPYVGRSVRTPLEPTHARAGTLLRGRSQRWMLRIEQSLDGTNSSSPNLSDVPGEKGRGEGGGDRRRRMKSDVFVYRGRAMRLEMDRHQRAFPSQTLEAFLPK